MYSGRPARDSWEDGVSQEMRARAMIGSRRLLVEREASARDRALAHLAEHCADRAYRIARDLLGDPAAAEDAVQEAMAVALGGVARLREPAVLEGWFYRVLTNHCMRVLRRQRWLALWIRRRAEDIDVAAAPAPDAALADARQRARLLLAVGQLPAMQKAAVVLRYGHDCPVEEVGSLLGVSPKTVKTHLVRGLRALRAVLGEER
jgi:RNA polymerase sigma-70 factor (ECF subfamily)